jgi:hypothetical protein
MKHTPLFRKETVKKKRKKKKKKKKKNLLTPIPKPATPDCTTTTNHTVLQRPGQSTDTAEADKNTK